MNHADHIPLSAYCGDITPVAFNDRILRHWSTDPRHDVGLLPLVGSALIMVTILSYIVLSALGLGLMLIGHNNDQSGVFTLGAGICLLTTMFYIYVWFIEPFLMGTNSRETRPQPKSKD